MELESLKIRSRVDSIIRYMRSERGIANWNRNRDQLRMSDYHNTIAAIQTATRLIVWERIAEVLSAFSAQTYIGSDGRAA